MAAEPHVALNILRELDHCRLLRTQLRLDDERPVSQQMSRATYTLMRDEADRREHAAWKAAAKLLREAARWQCLLCKSLQEGHHGTLDDKVTPCPNGVNPSHGGKAG